jgi:hypothetical protein
MEGFSCLSPGVRRISSMKDSSVTNATTAAGSLQNSMDYYPKFLETGERKYRYSQLTSFPLGMKTDICRLVVGLLHSSCQLLENILLSPSRNQNDIRARILLAERALSSWQQEISSSLNFDGMFSRKTVAELDAADPTSMMQELHQIVKVCRDNYERDSGVADSDVRREDQQNKLSDTGNKSAEDMFDEYNFKTVDVGLTGVGFESYKYPDNRVLDAGLLSDRFVRRIEVEVVDQPQTKENEKDMKIPAKWPSLPPTFDPNLKELLLPREFQNDTILSGEARSFGIFSRSICGSKYALLYADQSINTSLNPSILEYSCYMSAPVKYSMILPVTYNPILITVSDFEVSSYTISSDIKPRILQTSKLPCPLVSGGLCCVPDGEDPSSALLLHVDGSVTLLSKGVPQGLFRGFLPPAVLPDVTSKQESPMPNHLGSLPRLAMVTLRKAQHLALAYSLVPDLFPLQNKKVVVSLLNIPSLSSPTGVEAFGRGNQMPTLIHLEMNYTLGDHLVGVALSSDAQHLLECSHRSEGGIFVRIQMINRDKLIKCGEQKILDQAELLAHTNHRIKHTGVNSCPRLCGFCSVCNPATSQIFCKLSQDTYIFLSIVIGAHIVRFVSATKQVQRVAFLELADIRQSISVLAHSDTELMLYANPGLYQPPRMWSLKVTW